MRIVFFGTPDFAVETLKVLVEAGRNVVGVVTAPDKPAGRGRKLQESAVKRYAVSVGLTVLQPENLKSESFLAELRFLAPDLQIVVAFRMLPEKVWALPAKGTFNLHASLLPMYRGAAPINWAIINGERETGVTTFFIEHKIDTGNIIFQERVMINDNDDAGTLHDRLMLTGGALVLKTVDAILEGTCRIIKQESLFAEEEELKPAPKIYREDCRLTFSDEIVKINNKIRGLSPFPAAFTTLCQPDGKKYNLKLFSVIPRGEDHKLPSGSLVTDNSSFMKIACSNGFVQVESLQLEGRTRMDVKQFLLGFKDLQGCWCE